MSKHQDPSRQSLDDSRETTAALDPPATGDRCGSISLWSVVDRVPGRRVCEQGPREMHHAGVHGCHGGSRGSVSLRIQPVRQLDCRYVSPVPPRVTKRTQISLILSIFFFFLAKNIIFTKTAFYKPHILLKQVLIVIIAYFQRYEKSIIIQLLKNIR